MSVYIKGMEMPTGDEMLCINIFPDGKVTSHFDLRCMPVAKAVPVPPHGRLIDADALLEHMETEADNFKPRNMYDDGLLAGYNAAIRTIRETAPTIIPASEEGE